MYRGGVKLDRSECLAGKEIDSGTNMDLGPILGVRIVDDKLKVGWILYLNASVTSPTTSRCAEVEVLYNLPCLCFITAHYCHYFLWQFTFVHGQPRPKAICDFCWEKSPFSKKFRKASAAKEFLGIWESHIQPELNTTTGKYSPVSQKQNSSRRSKSLGESSQQKNGKEGMSSSFGKPSRDSPALPPLLLPASKKAKPNPSEKDGDQKIEECYAG